MANPNDVYLFWDNSNIYVGAQEVAKVKEPRIDPRSLRIHFKNLVSRVLRGRNLKGAFCGGSIPPASDEVWKYVEHVLGRAPVLYTRIVGEDGKSAEQGVDERIHLAMCETLLDEEPAVLALLTGDGAGTYETPKTNFPANLARAVKRNWDIEVYSWDRVMNSRMREFVQQNGHYFDLDDDYWCLTFTRTADRKHERPARDLPSNELLAPATKNLLRPGR